MNGNLPDDLMEQTSTKMQTEKFFNNYYEPRLEVAVNVNDAIQSFFEGITGDADSARVLATAVVHTSTMQGTDPMSIIEQFQHVPAGEINTYLSAFLNVSRVGTSLLGVKNEPKTGYFVHRSILA